MKKLTLTFFLVITSTISVAAEKSNSRVKKQLLPDSAVRLKMNNISGMIRGLGPFIASEEEFVKKSNSKVVKNGLEKLSSMFKDLKVHPVISTQGLSLSQTVMSEQLDQAVILYKNDKKAQSHAKFTAALNLCVSCHTQSPGVGLPKLFQDKDIKSMKLSSFEKAELFFITRDYEKAIELYDQFLLKSKATDDDEFIFKALERELIYFVKIKKDFKMAKSYFDKYLKKKNLNVKINEEIQDWSKTLGDKTLWDNFSPLTVTESEMEKFMNNFIHDEEEGPIFTVTNSSEVYDLNLSSILLDYYNAHPETKLGARILYWLAILDKRINDDLFFSVGDFYLVSCMEKYPQDKVAHDCYDAYVEDLEINYTMDKKGNKEFPKETIEKLNRLKKLINYTDSTEV